MSSSAADDSHQHKDSWLARLCGMNQAGPLNYWGRAFLSIVAVEGLINLVLSNYVALNARYGVQDYDIWSCASASVIYLFMIFFALDSMYCENFFSHCAFCLTGLLRVARTVLVRFVPPATGCLEPECPGEISNAVGLLLALVVGAIARRGMGWRFYRAAGADPNLRRIFSQYQLGLTVRQLDLSFAALLLLAFTLFNQSMLWPAVVSALAACNDIVWFWLSAKMVQTEDLGLYRVSLLLSVPTVIMCVLAVVNVATPFIGPTRSPLHISIVVATATLSLTFRAWSVFMLQRARSLFGQGMKEKVFPHITDFGAPALRSKHHGPRSGGPAPPTRAVDNSSAQPQQQQRPCGGSSDLLGV